MPKTRPLPHAKSEIDKALFEYRQRAEAATMSRGGNYRMVSGRWRRMQRAWKRYARLANYGT